MNIACYGELDCVIALVKAGADVNLRNEFGENAGDLNLSRMRRTFMIEHIWQLGVVN